jgi:release factor glutamine methyltransferase
VSRRARPTTDLSELVVRLREGGCVFAEDEAAVLAAEAPDAATRELLLRRRLAGEPLEQVVGWVEFAGLRVSVAPGVFVPRRRSEAVVAHAVRLARGVERPVVVDLCCGAGALGAAAAHAVPDARLHAADIDPAAVACARTNLPRGQVHHGDLYDALPGRLRGRVDVLVVNAPYVPSDEVRLMPAEARLHEPVLALDGGVDGLDLHRRVATGAPAWLSPVGHLVVETSRRQARCTAAACAAAGLLPTIHSHEDLDATVVVAGRRPGLSPHAGAGSPTGRS